MTTPGTPYYGTLKPEPIDIIEGWGLDYSSGNAIKYIARAGRKSTDPAEVTRDLEKAISYLRRRINAINGKASW